MLSAKTAADYVGTALDLFQRALKPTLMRKLAARHGSDWWRIAARPHLPDYVTAGDQLGSDAERLACDDAYLWLKIAVANQATCFNFTARGQGLLEDILAGRNRWAHGECRSLLEAGKLVTQMREALIASGTAIPSTFLALQKELGLRGGSGQSSAPVSSAFRGLPRPTFVSPASSNAPHSSASLRMSTSAPDLSDLRSSFLEVRERSLLDTARRGYHCGPDELLVFYHSRTQEVEICGPDPEPHTWQVVRYDRMARIQTSPRLGTHAVTMEFIGAKGYAVNVVIGIKLSIQARSDEKSLRDLVFRFDTRIAEFATAVASVIKAEVNRLFLARGECKGKFDEESRQVLARLLANASAESSPFVVREVQEVTLGDPDYAAKARPLEDIHWVGTIERQKIAEETATLHAARDYNTAVRTNERAQLDHELDMAAATDTARRTQIAAALKLVKEMGEDKLIALSLIHPDGLKMLLDYEINKARYDMARFRELAGIAESFLRAAAQGGHYRYF